MPGRRKSGPAFWALMRHRQPRQDGISARRPKSPVRRVSPPALRPAPYRKQPPTYAWAAQARTHSLNRALATGNRRLVLEPSDRHHPALLADESCAASLATPDAGVIGHPKPTAFAQSLRPLLSLPSRPSIPSPPTCVIHKRSPPAVRQRRPLFLLQTSLSHQIPTALLGRLGTPLRIAQLFSSSPTAISARTSPCRSSSRPVSNPAASSPDRPPANDMANLACSHRQDHHPRGGVVRHYRQCQVEDSGQGGHSSGPAAPDVRWQAARGWPHPV